MSYIIPFLLCLRVPQQFIYFFILLQVSLAMTDLFMWLVVSSQNNDLSDVILCKNLFVLLCPLWKLSSYSWSSWSSGCKSPPAYSHAYANWRFHSQSDSGNWRNVWPSNCTQTLSDTSDSQVYHLDCHTGKQNSTGCFLANNHVIFVLHVFELEFIIICVTGTSYISHYIFLCLLIEYWDQQPYSSMLRKGRDYQATVVLYTTLPCLV